MNLRFILLEFSPRTAGELARMTLTGPPPPPPILSTQPCVGENLRHRTCPINNTRVSGNRRVRGGREVARVTCESRGEKEGREGGQSRCSLPSPFPIPPTITDIGREGYQTQLQPQPQLWSGHREAFVHNIDVYLRFRLRLAGSQAHNTFFASDYLLLPTYPTCLPACLPCLLASSSNTCLPATRFRVYRL